MTFLRPGDTFVFAGEVLRFEEVRETKAIVTRGSGTLGLDEINEGFARLKSGEVVRQLIAF